MSRRSPPSSEAEDLTQFVSFKGTITRDGLVVPIRFRVRFGLDGELRFRVNPIPATSEALQLRVDLVGCDKAAKMQRYTITAVSAAGTRFESNSVILKRTGIRATPTSAHVTLDLGYSQAEFSRPQDNGDAPPKLRWALRGFEAWPGLSGSTAVGTIRMAGNYPSKGTDRISGVTSIEAHGPIADTTAWLGDAERLFHHVHDCMSFAMAYQVGYPVRDAWLDGMWRRTAVSQSSPRRSHQHVHHPMRMQEIFKAALESFEAPPVAIQHLGYAIEWMTLPATYTEHRLTNLVTALENLANSNLPNSLQLYLPRKRFDAFAKRAREFVGADLSATFADAAEEQLASIVAMREALPAKLQDLNRRPLFERIMILADQWKVPLEGINPLDIGAAIKARNSIVHRGYYYEPGEAAADQVDLWEHVQTMREVAVRFVLTIIGYRGLYLSFRGGQQDVAFPPSSA
ncbi:hypothetical protein [Phenylobacterium deserti]|uniref:ApeA N-terminal domain-containing protein n=1 Tax=Phenylobacterium deserti TaxID=1914756 RepID=A0A328A9V9_9CAUL|nr:hypothetical protein [Phenylobacterium deserti]RAK51315.1 hypothetical protein DJ018_15335 [Phenylobacterium deserti]